MDNINKPNGIVCSTTFPGKYYNENTNNFNVNQYIVRSVSDVLDN